MTIFRALSWTAWSIWGLSAKRAEEELPSCRAQGEDPRYFTLRRLTGGCRLVAGDPGG